MKQMENGFENNDRIQELQKIQKALDVYTLARRAYAKDERPLDDFDLKMNERQASQLLDGDGDGLRIVTPISVDIKFRYGPIKRLSEKVFHLDNNVMSVDDPDFQEFQKVVAEKFEQAGLPFHSI